MLFIPINYLMHMQAQPKVDRKILAYGVVSAAAIAAGVTWLIA